MRFFKKTQPFAKRRARHGFTLMEMTIASAISVLVMSGVISLQYMSGRVIKDLYGPTRARSERMTALVQTRFYLCDASVGSVTVSDADHRIRFKDPNMGGVTSEFYFDPDERTLTYKRDITQPDSLVVAHGPINISFKKGSKKFDPPNYIVYKNIDSMVTIFVETAEELSYANVDERDGETSVYLRNPAS